MLHPVVVRKTFSDHTLGNVAFIEKDVLCSRMEVFLVSQVLNRVFVVFREVAAQTELGCTHINYSLLQVLGGLEV